MFHCIPPVIMPKRTSHLSFYHPHAGLMFYNLIIGVFRFARIHVVR